jgi:hypothetical protein
MLADTSTTEAGTAPIEGTDNPMVNFDPSSPNAFSPPEYDSLPKEPPKYNEIFGHDNEAFTAEAETSFTNENPPDYTEENETERNRTNDSHSVASTVSPLQPRACSAALTSVNEPESNSMTEEQLSDIHKASSEEEEDVPSSSL